MTSDKYILLFDGQCVLCNGSVSWLIRRDKQDLFRFATQQSQMGQYLTRSFGVPQDLSTVALITPTAEVYFYSDVPLVVFKALGGFYGYLGFLTYIPKWVRDQVYKLVAKYRYRWFGKKSSACPIIPSNWRHKFYLDSSS